MKLLRVIINVKKEEYMLAHTYEQTVNINRIDIEMPCKTHLQLKFRLILSQISVVQSF